MSTASTTTKSTLQEDHLDVDPTVPGQQFVCLSFVSPEKILPLKEAYFRKAFWAFLKERHDEIDYALVENFEALYETFLGEQQQELEDAFHEENAFQTTIRGLKVRGTYNTKHEADVRARVLQKLDSSHHVFVAPVGYWLPWDPSADAIQDQVYQEEQLNELMKNYKVNEMKRDTFYEQQKDERKKAALEENERRKEANKKEASEQDTNEQEETLAAPGGSGGGSAQSLFDAVEGGASHSSLKDDFETFKKDGQ